MRRISFEHWAAIATVISLVACNEDTSGTSSAVPTIDGGAAHASPDSAPGAPPSGSRDAQIDEASALESDAGEGVDAGAIASPGCGALPLCDDFESAAVGALPGAPLWSVVTPSCSGSGALAIDGSIAHSGSRSVKVTGAGGYCNHVFFANASAMASIGAHIFARFFVRIATAFDDGHVTFLAMKDGSEGKDLRMGGQNKVLMWNRESDDATLPAMSPAGTAMSTSLAVDAWRCVEFEIDGAKGAMQTWVDGSPVQGLVSDGTPTPDVDAQWLSKPWKPSLTDVRFGWESYGGQAETLWFDDVALGAQRIGCGP